jgi:hypothetical protein
MANTKLLAVISEEKLNELGFKTVYDDTQDPRGTTYEIASTKFWVTIDAWGDVQIARKNPDTDFLNLKIETIFDLECILNWIAE